MYFAIFHFHGCRVGTARTLSECATAAEAMATAAGIMADTNSRKQAQRTPAGMWLERAFVYDAAGNVAAVIEQRPGQQRPQAVAPANQKARQSKSPSNQKNC